MQNVIKNKDNKSLFGTINKNKSSYLFLAPFIITFAIFTVIPVLSAIFLSFTNFNLVQTPTFAGIDNYARMILDDPVFLISIKNTLLFAFITGPVSYILCIMLAWLVNELSKKLRVIFTVIFYAPSLTINAIVIWTFVFSGDAYGFVNSTLMSMGIIDDPIQWLINPKYNMAVVY